MPPISLSQRYQRELQTIGATTLDEYRKYIERDAALERQFNRQGGGPASIDETIQILEGCVSFTKNIIASRSVTMR